MSLIGSAARADGHGSGIKRSLRPRCVFLTGEATGRHRQADRFQPPTRGNITYFIKSRVRYDGRPDGADHMRTRNHNQSACRTEADGYPVKSVKFFSKIVGVTYLERWWSARRRSTNHEGHQKRVSMPLDAGFLHDRRAYHGPAHWKCFRLFLQWIDDVLARIPPGIYKDELPRSETRRAGHDYQAFFSDSGVRGLRWASLANAAMPRTACHYIPLTARRSGPARPTALVRVRGTSLARASERITGGHEIALFSFQTRSRRENYLDQLIAHRGTASCVGCSELAFPLPTRPRIGHSPRPQYRHDGAFIQKSQIVADII